MACSILWSAPDFTSSSIIIRNSNIVICEPHFDRPTEPIRRISQTQAVSPKSLANIPCLYRSIQDNNRAPGYLRVPPWTQLQEQVKSMHGGSMLGNWCDFTARWFLHGSRPLYVCPNSWRYVQHWVTYISNPSCLQTLFLIPSLSITVTWHFQELFTFSFLWRERRKMNVSAGGKFVGTTGYRSVYGKTSPDSEMGVIHIIIG